MTVSRGQSNAPRLCILASILIAASLLPADVLRLSPPPTPRHEVREVVHGVELVDPYRWLEDQDSPETRAWIEAQNEYTRQVLGQLEGKEELRYLVSQFVRLESYEPPFHRDTLYFFMKRRPEDDLSCIYVRRGLHGEDQLLIDPHPLSPDHTTSVSLMEVSPDGDLLVYAVRSGGEDEVTLKIFDVQNLCDLPDHFARGRYSNVCFTPAGVGFYYATYGAQGERIRYHRLGTDFTADSLIFGEGYGPGIGISADLSDDGHYLLLTVYYGSAASKTEVYFIDLIRGGEIRTVVNDIDATFEGKIGDTCLYLKTDWSSPNGRIIVVDLENPARSAWREVIPESETIIEDFTLAGGYLLVRVLDNVRPAIRVYRPDGELVTTIQVPAPGYLSYPRSRWSDTEAFFTYSSLNIPPTIYRYDLKTLTESVWARVEAPLESNDFVVEQVWYTSKDGTRVPMFISHRRDLRLDGSNPALLTGYGGFRVSLKPYFSARYAVWLKLGGVCAIANLRGGGELGEKWHRQGMLDLKQHTFDDFIAAAEWLIANGYTSPSKLAITGGSNGGLLVGAALTQHPDLFKAVVCAYPLLDMIRYHKFLVGSFWIPEYGSPEDPDRFKVLYAYSPYHNVHEGIHYPAVLFVTGDADTRVDPLHARKMTALLQAATGSDNPILLDYDTRAGHSGGKPTTKHIEDLTLQLLFLTWQLQMGSELKSYTRDLIR